MPTKTEATTAESKVTEDMAAEAQADLAAKAAERAQAEEAGVRTFKRGVQAQELYVSDLYQLPKELNLEALGPTSFLTQFHGEITGAYDTQEFTVVAERLNGLVFDKPARDIERGRSLKVVKAIKPNGDLVQLGYEDQINNTAAGEYGDAIGLRRMARKGFILLYDLESAQSIYCCARNCWAAAMIPQLIDRYPEHQNALGTNYCSWKHFEFTRPNEAAAARGMGGMFSVGATTTASRR